MNGNNHHYHKGKSNKPHMPNEKFDGNCKFCGIYGRKDNYCFKKKSERNGKGKDNMNNFKVKKNKKKSAYVYDLYSKSNTFSNDWIVDLGCTTHMSFKRNKFENFHRHKKDALVIGNNSMLEVQGIGSILMHGKMIEDVIFISKLGMDLLLVIQIQERDIILTSI